MDVTVSLENGKVETDVYVKPTDTHLHLHSSSCHRYHCKNGIPYSQTLRVNRTCSDMKCNNLQRWLLERDSKEKKLRIKVLRGRAVCRDNILNRQRILEE